MDQKDNIYYLYKPLRNYLRQLSLMDSLAVIRAYLQNLQFNQKFPNDVQVDGSFLYAKSQAERVKSGVYEWQLEMLVREIILNSVSENEANTLKNWVNFSMAINKLKDLENNISVHYADMFKDNILLELHRLSHRQFPWQVHPNLILITRYYKIFSHPQIDLIIQKHVGLTTKELYTIGLALTGVYIEYFALNYPPDLQIIGIDKKKLDSFLEHFSVDMHLMKNLINDSQSYDQDYAYTLNPIRIKPLIRTIYNGKDSIIAPVPTYLLKRFTEGVYYEILKDADFAHPFGESFQSYIGEVIKEANSNSRYEYFKEIEYLVGKAQKNSTDWIVTDENANIFIECKTKRLRAQAKVSLIGNSILEEDLSLMADFVVQVYATLADYRKGLYDGIENNEKISFPLVVTLEEWYAFGDKIISQMLDDKIKEKLTEKSIDISIIEKEPYTICSTSDFEALMQVINLIDIKQFMAEKTSGEYRLWTLGSFMFNKYPKEYAGVVDLFPNDYKEIHPGIADR